MSPRRTLQNLENTRKGKFIPSERRNILNLVNQLYNEGEPKVHVNL